MAPARQRLLAIVVIVLGVVLTAGLVFAYTREAEARSISLAVGDPKATDRIDMRVDLVSIDPVKEEATFRLDFEPKGSLVATDGITLAKELRLIVNAATGSTERAFLKNRVMSPQDVVVDLQNGLVSDYPLDGYDAVLEMLLAVPTTGSIDVEPISATVNASLHGWKFDAGQGTEHAVGYAKIHVGVSRSPATFMVAVAMMALFWLLALSAAALTWLVAAVGRKIEPPVLIWAAGLLFALVAFRGAMPGSPAIGALADYAAFFPAEIMVAICLVALVVTYLRRLGMQ